MNKASVVGTAALSLSALGYAGVAHAAPCSSLPNVVYVSGSSAVSSLVTKLQPVLSKGGADAITLVYKQSGSCSGVAAVNSDPAVACTNNTCISGAVPYFDATGTMGMCDLDVAGTHIDIALSDVYKESCAADAAALQALQSLQDRRLMVLPFGFIVPKGSAQTAIDAREAYYVFGQGEPAGITPWNQKANIFQRDPNSGTQITIFKNIRIPTGSAFGTPASGSGDMITKVAAGNVTSAVGIVGLDVVDTGADNRGKVKTLAYRHYEQEKFYWADSTPTAFDKKNVRDGHYPLWSYEHAIFRADAKAAVKKLADYLDGTTALPGGADLIKLDASANVIPLCAMDVQRSADAGDFSLATVATCGCAFDAAVGAACTACTTDAQCNGGVCRNSLCESR